MSDEDKETQIAIKNSTRLDLRKLKKFNPDRSKSFDNYDDVIKKLLKKCEVDTK